MMQLVYLVGFKGTATCRVTFNLVVDKTIFMWLIHTCQFPWNTELTCFIQEFMDLEVFSWNIYLPQPAFIHKMSVLPINIEFGEVYFLWSHVLIYPRFNKNRLTCSSNILIIRELNINQILTIPSVCYLTASSLILIGAPFEYELFLTIKAGCSQVSSCQIKALIQV